MIGKRDCARFAAAIEHGDFAHAVARKHHAVGLAIHDAGGDRPLEMPNERAAPFLIRSQHDQRVARAFAQSQLIQKRIPVAQSALRNCDQTAFGSVFRGTELHPALCNAGQIPHAGERFVGMINAKAVHIVTLLPCPPPYYAGFVNSMPNLLFLEKDY